MDLYNINFILKYLKLHLKKLQWKFDYVEILTYKRINELKPKGRVCVG